MRLGILETGRLDATLEQRFGAYPSIFGNLYQAVDPTVQVIAVPVVDGDLPSSPDACDAWLVTGSKHGVYDDLPWIEPLKEFLRAARAARVPQIGICFGHQIMAEAFGGRAEKSERGWGCGVHRYTTLGRAGWCRQAPESFTMHAMHQDQVTALPDDATVLATSDFCPYAMVAYGDPEEPHAISIQPHPEFDATFAAALLERRSGVAVPEELATRALATVHDPVDGTAFARWSLDYVRQSLAARRAA